MRDMNTHPDETARERMLQESQVKSRSPFPTWNGPVLEVKKLDSKATVPTKVNETDAGYDLYALNGTIIDKHCHKLIKTGIAFSIPDGYAGLIWPRSGMAYKHGIDVFAGVIDSSYRGDVGVILYNSQYSNYKIEAGDRIAQIVFQKVQDFDLRLVTDLDDTERGLGGFGSSGS